MPYTFADFIESGKITTAKDYLKICTREFGIMADFSNETGHVVIPEAIGTPAIEYYSKRLSYEKELLSELEAMTPEDISNRNEQYYRNELEDRQIAYDHAVEIDRKYYDILCKIQKWHPDEKYMILKEHAIAQINDARPNLSEYEKALKFKKVSDKEWYDAIIDETKSAIKRYEKKANDEAKRVKDEQEWHSGLIAAIEELEE